LIRAPIGAKEGIAMTEEGNMPQLDETQACHYIGKTALIGVTYLDHEGNLLERRQWAGRIVTFSNTQGIKVELFDSDEPCCLPPDPRAITKAEPGKYRLKSTGRVIENPDYLCTWICTRPSPEEREKIRRRREEEGCP
jgi:hypothetical protein